MEGFKEIEKRNVAEIEIKKSRFIATVCPVKNEKEALDFVAEMRKKYWDARHNVFAFSIRENGLRRYSDDGEPHSTAGLPVLEAIIHSGIENVAVVVTRYFGGILLGTGGLVRAYSESAKMGLETAETVTVLPTVRFEIECEYSDYEPLIKISEKSGVKILSSDFESLVKINFAIPKADFEEFCKKTEDSFCGRLKIKILENIFMGF